ncbi:MAG: hypothetical protein KBA53_07805 [Thermoclostridium sp.]|nr:hypothetical protein [Thermoclostridium sp.]
MIEVKNALQCLFEEGRVFVSEADFQFAYAWKIKELYPDASIRLEYIPWLYDKNMHIDIAVFINERMVPIELKYKTKGFTGNIDGDSITLKNQGAQDIGRYDFLYDVQRMEGISKSGLYPIEKAYAVLLTNDSGYWVKSNKSGTNKRPVDDEFRIHEGIIITGQRAWKPEAGAGTMRNREVPINIQGEYRIAWNDYRPADKCEFRYTIVEISA